MVERIGNDIFASDIEKPWRPLGIVILFLCRQGLSPYHTPASTLRERTCRQCADMLRRVLGGCCEKRFVSAMPKSFKYLLRR